MTSGFGFECGQVVEYRPKGGGYEGFRTDGKLYATVYGFSRKRVRIRLDDGRPDPAYRLQPLVITVDARRLHAR